MLEHLIKYNMYDVTKLCVYADGEYGPSFDKCFYRRIAQAKCSDSWHTVMHFLI